jgi:hypothetical protein
LDQYSSTLDQIQRLSNERLKLYSAKWPRRNQSDYRDAIKALNRVIADLWHEHRCELASANRRSVVPKEVEPAIAQDYFAHSGTPLPSTSYQVQHGERWWSVDDKTLSKAIGRWVADIPADDPDEIVEVPPLKEVLRNRGLTLRWESTRAGVGYHRLVSSSSI